MNRIIFKCKYFQIRVREAILFVVLLLLLFFCFHSCGTQQEEMKKESIQDICKVVKGNIHNFDKLMKRANLCSEGWLKDYKDYKKRIHEQMKWMKKEKPKKYQLFLKKQEMFDKALVKFEKKQSKKNSEQLEISMKAYQKAYEKGCK